MKMTYSRNIILVCLPLWLFLACGQENKQPRNSPTKANRQEIDSREQAEHNQKAAEVHHLAEQAKINQQKDSLFLARLRRLDTVFVGKGLRLHCKGTTEAFQYQDGDIERIVEQLEIDENLLKSYSNLSGQEQADKIKSLLAERESKRIAKFADRVRRTDTHLELRLANGKWHRFKSDKVPSEDIKNVNRPTFIDYIQEKSLYLVHIELYEGERFVMVDALGRETFLTCPPVCSPTRKYFASTQYRGLAGDKEHRTFSTFLVTQPFYLQMCDKPDKKLFFGYDSMKGKTQESDQMPKSLLGAGELFGRVVWIKENVFLLQVSSGYFDATKNEKPNFGVVRCEIIEN